MQEIASGIVEMSRGSFRGVQVSTDWISVLLLIGVHGRLFPL
jgi:hypothetical protein